MELEYNLNDEWIKEFDKIDKLYEDFYKDDLYYINLRAIYVNRNNEIDKLTNETYLMNKPNYISREEILWILKKMTNNNEKKYTLLSLLKYNILLEPDEVKYYIMKGDGEKDKKEYLTVIKNIDTIKYDKTISMLHDLNDLIFIFYEKSEDSVKKDPNNTTKRIFIKTSNTNKKTIKKRFKD